MYAHPLVGGRLSFCRYDLAATLLGACLFVPICHADLDRDNNQLSDIWQLKFGASTVAANADTDGDGYTNAQEALFATNPLEANSWPGAIGKFHDGVIDATWKAEPGKLYHLESSENLINWQRRNSFAGEGSTITSPLTGTQGKPLFFRVEATDVDSDGDGLSDWEELSVGYNPNRIFSEGLGSNPTTPTTNNPKITDKERLATALTATTSTITVAAADSGMAENWPDPGRFVIRRTGKLDAVTVAFSYGGTAANGTDYTAPSAIATIPFGADEVSIRIIPMADVITEPTETVTLTLLSGTGYTLGATTAASIDLLDSTDGKPSTKAATRFLEQASFGAAPNELARVKNLGYSAWLDEQFQRTPNLHLPIVQAWQAELAPPNNSALVTTEHRMEAWWRQSMRSDADSDPLRQRMAYALSQIFVISDRMDALADQRGVASYYDMLLNDSFGTYRQLLEDVTRHPWMGLYLSAMKNRKANVAANRFPDENYAREIMQLFSIGLWRLNADGTQYLSNGSDLGPDGEVIPAGQPVPTYGQSQVAMMARFFTGMSYSKRFTSLTDATEIPATKFYDSYNIPWQPMRMFDAEHDVAAKTLSLPGMAALSLPARTASSPDTGTAGNADLSALLDHLSNHPNIAPFISRLLIQRLVTSNPSPAYVGRVSAAFNNNGSGVRGDLKAVLKAILLDAEARDYSRLFIVTHGMIREPYVRYIAMARALEAAPADPSAGGRYRGFGSLDGDFLQRPLSAPSVFNFYSPENKPAGPLRDAGLSSPEMQIINSVTAITGPNRYSSSLSVANTTLNTSAIPTNSGWTQINPSGQSDITTTPENENFWNTRINEEKWLALATSNPAALSPDAIVSSLDEMLCYGNMSERTYRAITRALNRQDDPFAAGLTTLVRDQRIRARLRNAIHLTTISADYAVLK